MIFDTHAHYDDKAYDPDREEVLRRVHAAGVGLICNVGADLKGSRASVELAEGHDFIYAAVGVHPDETGELNEGALAEIKELAADRKAAAIGEIGLDYHGFERFPGKPGKDVQRYWFKRQLETAVELGLPVVIHSRNAAQETFEMMSEAAGNGLKGAVIHCYSYSAELAARYVEMGFYIGIGGAVTYEGHRKLIRALEAVPVERILLETDCPYMTPLPVRDAGNGPDRPVPDKAADGPERISAGNSAENPVVCSAENPAGNLAGRPPERNLSTYLCFVRDRIAGIKGISPAELEDITFENGRKFYGV